jgi:hypothetical protein
MARLTSNLEVLEVPTDMSSLYFSSRANTIYDVRKLPRLKELDITMKAVWWMPNLGRNPRPTYESFFLPCWRY